MTADRPAEIPTFRQWGWKIEPALCGIGWTGAITLSSGVNWISLEYGPFLVLGTRARAERIMARKARRRARRDDRIRRNSIRGEVR